MHLMSILICHTCEVGLIISAKEKCSRTVIDRFVNSIWNWSFVYVENVLDFSDQLIKNGSTNKSVYLFLQCIDPHSNFIGYSQVDVVCARAQHPPFFPQAFMIHLFTYTINFWASGVQQVQADGSRASSRSPESHVQLVFIWLVGWRQQEPLSIWTWRWWMCGRDAAETLDHANW